MRHPIISFLLIATGSYGAAFIAFEGAYQGLGGWYLTLEQPPWAIPFWAFEPALALLSGLFAFGAWFVYRAEHRGKRVTLGLLIVQLLLVALWPWMFFAWHQLMVSTIASWALTIVAAAAMVLSARIGAKPALLLAPLVVWLCYVASLNTKIWSLNRPSPADRGGSTGATHAHLRLNSQEANRQIA